MSIMKIKREIINNPSLLKPNDGDGGEIEDGLNEDQKYNRDSNIIIEESKEDGLNSKSEHVRDDEDQERNQFDSPDDNYEENELYRN